MALATAFVRILSESKGLKPGVVTGAQKAGAAGGKAGGGAFKGAFLGGVKGLAGPLTAVFGAKAIFGFFKDSVGAASDLGESINAVQVTFGEASAGILKLSKNAAKGVGLSKSEFNGLAVQFSAFAKTIAGKGGDVTGTIDGITKRAADFASVMNLDVAEAAQLFQSGLAGETEPLRRFGIDLSAAAVQAHAYKEGIAESGEELTEAQKVQARYSLLLKQTAVTQDDFANTSGSLANQQRILGARFDNLKATIGQALLPAVTAVVTAFNSLFTGGLKGNPILASLGSAFGSIWAVVQSLLPTLQKLWTQFTAVALPAFQRIATLLTETVAPSFATFFTAAQPVLKFLIQTVGGALIGAFKGAATFIEGTLQIVAGVLDVFTGLFTGDWSKLWGGVRKIAAGIWDAIRGAFQVFINLGIVRLLRVGLSLIRALWSGAWNTVRSFASGSWSRITASVRKGIDDVVSFMKGLPGRILRALGNLGRLLFSAGRDILRGLLDGIKSIAGSVKAQVEDTVSGIVGGVTGFLGIGSPSKLFAEIGMDTMRGYLLGIQQGAHQLEGSMVRATAGTAVAAAGTVATSTAGAGGFVGNLYLDSGEFLGAVRGEISASNANLKRRTMAGTGLAR